MPTQQGTFDTVLAHARKQGKKSLAHNDQSRCLYRNEDGLMCFVGVLIPDDRYQETMENQTANYEGEAIHKKEVGNLLKELGYDTTLCRRLQLIHDCSSIDQWEEEFSYLASGQGLSYSPLL